VGYFNFVHSIHFKNTYYLTIGTKSSYLFSLNILKMYIELQKESAKLKQLQFVRKVCADCLIASDCFIAQEVSFLKIFPTVTVY